MPKMSDSGAAARLYTSAADTLRECDLDLNRATPKWVRVLKRDHALLTALARKFLTSVAADMRNAAATTDMADAAPASQPHSPTAATTEQAEAAPATNSDPHEAQSRRVGGQPVTAATTAQAEAAVAPDPGPDEAQAAPVGGLPSTRPAMPSAQQRAAERALSRSTSIFDTWKCAVAAARLATS